MKKLLQLSTTLIVISIMFSSCDSSFSIVKRHYNKGYYIDYTRNNTGITSKISHELLQPLTTPEGRITKEPLKQNNTLPVPVAYTKEHTPVTIANGEKMFAKVNLHQVAKQNQFNKIAIPVNLTVRDNKGSFESSSPDNISDHDHDRGERAALSLLWLVIVVVLILWLIGILVGGFGLGRFINLLLVVALILLILWLLRII
jgi:hypothetical protein